MNTHFYIWLRVLNRCYYIHILQVFSCIEVRPSYQFQNFGVFWCIYTSVGIGIELAPATLQHETFKTKIFLAKNNLNQS